MNKELLEACSDGNLELFLYLVGRDPNILTSETPARNNCLHLAAMLGYHEFAREVWSRVPSLFSSTNEAGETPLVLALASANNTLASEMIAAATQLLQPDSTYGMEGGKPLNEMLLKFDKSGENVLHHAMRNDFEDLAIRLLDIEPQLSEKVNERKESPMHMAARRGYAMVLERLINIRSAATSGPGNYTALHAAVDAGHTGVVNQLLEMRPELANQKTHSGYTVLEIATLNKNPDMVKILLSHDLNLGYIKSNDGYNPFLLAAFHGFVPIAEEIFRVCPDSAYDTTNECENALHIAVGFDQRAFVEYILRNSKLHRLIHHGDKNGNLPLHIAAQKCNPQILRLLLDYKRQDSTAFNASNSNAVDLVSAKTNLCKTLKWNESYTLVSSSIPSTWGHSAIDKAKKEIEEQAIIEIKSLRNRYTANTSLVAALLATITFAAAFTLPGGYSSDSTSDAGQPIFGMKAAFQVFLISDTIAMCSSLAVAFLCILATWEDLDYLLNYRKTTKALMWCAYMTTALAFGTGLFTVIAPKNMWLAILILVLSSILPFVSKIINEWPKIKLWFLGRPYREDLIPDI